MRSWCRGALVSLTILASVPGANGDDSPRLEAVQVEGQPLGANVLRVLEALRFLGAPLSDEQTQAMSEAARARDASRLQELLDPQVLLVVSINPESRVRVARGPAAARLQQAGHTPVLIKVVNDGGVTPRLRISSPQAGPVYAGVAELSMRRQQQEPLRENENTSGDDRFLHVEMFSAPPLTERLSGLEVEYAVALIYSSESGRREAAIAFDVGQGTQDLGFRAATPVLFDVRPAISLRLAVRDVDGQPSTARLLFQDEQGRVYPPQPKRLAPDLFFQPQIYRRDGENVVLPPGRLTVLASRGPEYVVERRELDVAADGPRELRFELRRWVDPSAHGFYSGDHHIHAAGCAHYTQPTQGITPQDMFAQVQGEGLNVGCVLTWGPCFDHQRQFFAPDALTLSEPRTLLKYDLEISGFGSQALGHVCLLNLRDQTYPGTDGSTTGWPTWTTPVMRWCREQGGVAGYAHSASGMAIDPAAAARRLLARGDADQDSFLSLAEASTPLLPEPAERIDTDGDGRLSLAELTASLDRVADRLPNLAIPELNGVGAMEIFVSCSEGVCDFISAMDTARVQEWNTWYHLLNCGMPLKVSGETDFPCMSGRNVGQGRVYVRLGELAGPLDFADWCRGLAEGRSYVSDGYAHPLEFRVSGRRPGEGSVPLESPGEVEVDAMVTFAPATPRAVAHGLIEPPGGRRLLGDTVLLHGPRHEDLILGGERQVELIVNGEVVAREQVPADGRPHPLKFRARVERSSWVALRHFPQFHTNPVEVLVAGRPIRASRASAQWCHDCVEQLWENRGARIAEPERAAARAAFDRAQRRYLEIAAESAP